MSLRNTAGATAAVMLAISPSLLLIGRAALSVSLIIALLAASAAVDWRAVRDRLTTASGNLVVRLGALVPVVWLISIPGSLDMNASFGAWGQTVVLGAAGLFFWAGFATGGLPLRLAMKALIVSMGVALGLWTSALAGVPEVIGLIKFKGWVAIEASAIGKPLANGWILAAPLMLAAAWRLGGNWRWAALGILGLTLYLSYATAARSAQAGAAAGVLMAALVVFFALQSVKLRIAIAAGTIGFVAAMVGVALSNAQMLGADRPEAYMNTSLLDYHRQMIWQFTFNKALESPWVGYGMDAVNKVEGASVPVPGLPNEFIPSHPHNWVLEILSETGLPGLLALVVFVTATGIWLIRRYAQHRAVALIGAAGVFGVYWGSGLFNFSFWAPWWAATHMVCFMLCFALLSDEDRA